jgi:hypothetical protein
MAAASLRGICDSQRPSGMARTLVKIAVLLARASDVPGAVDALEDAERLDQADAMASELLGTISGVGVGGGVPEAAAKAYPRRRGGARRRGRRRRVEDRLGLEIAPHDEAAAEAMVAALTACGGPAPRRSDARMPRRRRAARWIARSPYRAPSVAAVNDGDAARAWLRVDATLRRTSTRTTPCRDREVFGRRLYELWRHRARQASGGDPLGDVRGARPPLRGPLATRSLIEAWIEAAASDPGNAAAHAILREHASTLHDVAPLIEALIHRRATRSTGRCRRADWALGAACWRRTSSTIRARALGADVAREAGAEDDPAAGGQRGQRSARRTRR